MTVTQPQLPSVEGPAAEARPAKAGAGRRIARGLIGLALAAAAVYAQTFEPSYEEQLSNLTVHGRIGEVVHTSRYSVKVNWIKAALSVDTKNFGVGDTIQVRTSNLFLVVNISARGVREPFRLSQGSPPVLRTRDDRVYWPTDKVDSSLTLFSKWIQPGLWSSGVLVYEVPKDAVPGARLVFAPPAGLLVVDLYQPETEIDLGLTGGAAARLIDEAEEYHTLVNKK
ncbi:hypothetical protein TBS_28000 [Thermobispora bispora]|jgi:hypothetical protein|uniref:Uncharacterized protein n=1 Tax=Thermobispora bispora (strain ATCC 19993 / DSM 43833 / CBS 139.67 / JCM 10125 / KCTC 9307 / NBRC 14880 / R51) TaxID=469371 RepID=D6Y4D8_THEBD|nr:DUF4352 domain-containing protein [Thermobispora bispora]MBO2475695.1 DUF4352 domain-containing protein [Actinomycetales bacterium]MDI9581219.1 DUF4352 domain-containing protein [Thermobispora sp.]ADG87192.1 hypothetical protein Tbis_0464 [Thermobispora bispora DSM 43833]MBX6168808.1 DUF4352 domain-containing protein [Thermobispora bispora]QSI47153.1 DUF4352 domain-containing protein [Thermobispora bispora]